MCRDSKIINRKMYCAMTKASSLDKKNVGILSKGASEAENNQIESERELKGRKMRRGWGYFKEGNKARHQFQRRMGVN